MFLVYDISDNIDEDRHSTRVKIPEFLSLTNNFEDIISICNKQSELKSNGLSFLVVPIGKNGLGYYLYSDGLYSKYMAIDSDFNHTNPVLLNLLIPFIRNYKIEQLQ